MGSSPTDDTWVGTVRVEGGQNRRLHNRPEVRVGIDYIQVQEHIHATSTGVCERGGDVCIAHQKQTSCALTRRRNSKK